MATTIVQFPAGVMQQIGANSSVIVQPPGDLDADMFVAPLTGIYLISFVAHIISSEGGGGSAEVIAATPTTGQIVDVFVSGDPGSPDSQFVFAAWFEEGDVFEVSASRPSLVDTVYGVYVTVLRLL